MRVHRDTATTFESLQQRFEAAVDHDGADVQIESGGLDDYRTLAKFHYRGGHPGAVASVLRIVHRGRSVTDRFHDLMRDGRTHERSQTQIVGVLVRSLPALACGSRDLATNGRYADLTQREAAVLLNREVRTISRVIIHPQWRGLGLAVKLVRRELANPEPSVLFTEALAAMGRVSPFFERAGMTRFERPLRSRPDDARLIDAIEAVAHSSRKDRSAAAAEPLPAELWTLDCAGFDARESAFLLRELRRWHQVTHRMPNRVLHGMSIDELLRSARNELLARPAYFIFNHSGHGIQAVQGLKT